MIDEVDRTCRDTTVYMIGAEGQTPGRSWSARRSPGSPSSAARRSATGPVDRPRTEGAGRGTLITIEIDAAQQAGSREFSLAGLEDVVDARVGDAKTGP